MPHVALLGPPTLLDRCAPRSGDGLAVTRIEGSPAASAGVDALIAFEPSRDQWETLDEIGLATLIWWQDAAPSWATTRQPAQRQPRRTVTGGRGATPGGWRSIPLPVADDLFSDSQRLSAEGDSAVAVNFDDEGGPASLHQALVALARGQLLVSEPLLPSRGLEPGIDYVEARTPDEVRAVVENAARSPGAFERMRLRGRRKAELFRSSRVVARLVDDLLLELDLAPAAR
ncbi:MAG TPA: hypothetical protein VEW67_08885 [Thermoleophilaceae bacterium]|nr:hypothetical protein [Thermoleophilaceae bacterium]